MPARLLDRDALGQRVAAHRQLRALDGVVHRRIELGLDADDLGCPASARLAATAMPEISPPPPIGTTSVSRSRHLLQHLERDGALPGDDMRIVEGMDEGQALRLAVRCARIAGLVERLAVEDDLGAVVAWCARPSPIGVPSGITMVAGMPSRLA